MLSDASGRIYFTWKISEKVRLYTGAGWLDKILPWAMARALEACGILPDRSAERAEAKKHKRIASKRKMTQYKLAKQNGKTE